MSDATPAPQGSEFASVVERSLHEKLELVRSEPPAAASDLAPSVARTLRWQALIVLPATAAAALAGGLIAGFRMLARSRGGS